MENAHPTCGTLFTIAVLIAFCPNLRAQDIDAQQRLREITTATSIDRPGQLPWHLKLSFQLFDLRGKLTETGSVEEWWASKDLQKIVITSPSLNQTEPIPDGSSEIMNREAFLVHQLLDEVVHPIQDFDSPKLSMVERSITVGKAKLDCIQIGSSSLPPRSDPDQSEFCAASTTASILRIHYGPGPMSVVRNKLGQFLNTSVAVDTALMYGSHVAISGHIDALETFDSKAAGMQLESIFSASKSVPSLVTKGKRLTYRQPSYPVVARMHRTTGTVVLCALISKQGSTASVDVISSPDLSLSQAAMEAVREWTYTPFTTDGKPIDVNTTVIVRFSIGS